LAATTGADVVVDPFVRASQVGRHVALHEVGNPNTTPSADPT